MRKGTNTKVHKRTAKNGLTADEIIPLYANVNGRYSSREPIQRFTRELPRMVLLLMRLYPCMPM